MAILNIRDNNLFVDEREKKFSKFLKDLKKIELLLFRYNNIPKTSFTSWDLKIENDSTSPLYQGSNQIKIGVDFIKRILAMTNFFMCFYKDVIAKKDIASHKFLFECVQRGKIEFFSLNTISKCDREIEKISSLNVKIVCAFSIHYFICHEIGHSIHPDGIVAGDTADVIEKKNKQMELKCDAEATDIMINLLNNAYIQKRKRLFMQVCSGGLIAQILIAGLTKQNSNLTNYDEKNSKDHPLTYDRIFHFLIKRKVKGNATLLEVFDNCHAYMFIALIFLYHKFNYQEILELIVSFKEVCLFCARMLKCFNQSELKNFSNSRRICFDEVVGVINNKRGKWKFKRRQDFRDVFVPADEYRSYYGFEIGNPLIFILECPHKKEFFNSPLKVLDGNVEVFSRPANGTTKKYFDRYIEDVLVNLNVPLDNKSHPIVIMNAVRFQCSLGLPVNIYRNLYFEKFFDGDIFALSKKMLYYRIKKLHPYFVINATTRGDAVSKGSAPKYEIRVHVDDFLNSKRVPFIKAFHPKSWRQPRNRVKRI